MIGVALSVLSLTAVLAGGVTAANAGVQSIWGEVYISEGRDYSMASVRSIDFDSAWALAVQDAVIRDECTVQPGQYCVAEAYGSPVYWGAPYDYANYGKM